MNILLLNEDELKYINRDDISKSSFIVIKKNENLFHIIKNRYGTQDIMVDRTNLQIKLIFNIINNF